MNNEQIQLTNELKYILDKDPSNINKIFEISNMLAQTDDSQVRFSVDAGIIDRLGKELVARHETAVSELVKNAYDADATNVVLEFINSSKEGGNLLVDDNGVGMTKEQLVNGFMRLASSEKLHYPVSTIYSRTRAGKKGIGRFAAQRLGHIITITTQTEHSENALEITISWDDFKTDVDLMLVANKISYVERMKKNSGTRLYIKSLRDKWTESQIKRVYRYTSEILQPFPLSKFSQHRKGDPGFKLICKSQENGVINVIANDNTMFFEHALAKINAYVDDEGYIFLTILSKKLKYVEKNILLNPENPLVIIRNVYLQAFYFIYNQSGINSPMIDSFIREIARDQGGIRLYRNGFRVLPYGEPDNDWLGLDASVRRRSILPPHGNINFFGFIEINGQDETFDELSSREGLQENQALNEMKDFGYMVLIDAILKVASIRGVKQSTNQKTWKIDPEEKIDEAIEGLEQLSIAKDNYLDNNSIANNGLEVIEKLEQITIKLKEAKEEQKQKQKEIIEEKNLLRILAGLGLTIGEFIHEIKQYQAALEADSKSLKRLLNNHQGDEIADRLQENINSLSTYTSYFDDAISGNILRELRPVELRSVVYALKRNIDNDLKRRNFEFVDRFNGYHLYTCPMHKSEWASILFNLYTNARKAIYRAKIQQGRIYIDAGRIRNMVYLEFSDNGDGISIENRDKVFNAFYTTSSPTGKLSNMNKEMTGTGLGLKIVKDIISSYGGTIYVKEPVDGYKTTFRIELPWQKDGFKYV